MNKTYRNLGIATLVAGALALGGCKENEPIVGKATYDHYKETLVIAANDGKQYEVELIFGADALMLKDPVSEDLFTRAVKGAQSADWTFHVIVRDPGRITCIDAFCETMAYAQNVSFSPAENPNVSR